MRLARPSTVLNTSRPLCLAFKRLQLVVCLSIIAVYTFIGTASVFLVLNSMSLNDKSSAHQSTNNHSFIAVHSTNDKVQAQALNRSRKSVPDEAGGRRDLRQQVTNSTITIARRDLSFMVEQLIGAPYDGVDRYIQYTSALLDLKPSEGAQSTRLQSEQVFNDFASLRYPISAGACPRYPPSVGPRLFVAVISALDNFDKRAAIRQTWGRQLRTNRSSQSAKRVGPIFFVGVRNAADGVQERLVDEHTRLGDVVQIDVFDSYYNLSVKSVAVLHWIDNHCQGDVDFVLKVDDDVYVNERNLATTLQSIPADGPPSVYGTHLHSAATPIREGKWKVDHRIWPWSAYPPFFMGAAVVLSAGAVPLLLTSARVTPYFVWDDVYLLGLCTEKARVRMLSSDGLFDIRPEFDTCLARDTITWLTDSDEQMRASHRATEDFYSGVRLCVNPGPTENDPPQVADPHETVRFLFQPVGS